MLKKFQFTLIFLMIVSLGSSVFGFANEKNLESLVHKSESAALNKQQIIEALNMGNAAGATYVLIIWDTYNFEDSYQFVEYGYPGDDVDNLINHYSAPGYYKVSKVFGFIKFQQFAAWVDVTE